MEDYKTIRSIREIDEYLGSSSNRKSCLARHGRLIETSSCSLSKHHGCRDKDHCECQDEYDNNKYCALLALLRLA